MDRVLKFLDDNKVFYIATVDNGQARVRPFGVALLIDGKLSICTGAFKDVFKQIKANPNVEISSTNATGDTFIRITGKLIGNSTSQNREKFFQKLPHLKSLYKDENVFEVLTFESGTAIFYKGNTAEDPIKL
jgi:uncharacterized pyridoxamine 5'-phosphate oxidase family protein